MGKGTLHPQKPEGQRRRRNAPTHDTTTVYRDGEVRGPSIEEATGIDPDTLQPQVVLWWETWRRAPQAQAFEPTDWLRLATMVPLVDALWKKPTAAAMAEVRMNEEKLGATVTDRMRARIRIEDLDDEARPGGGAAVVPIGRSRDDLKARLRAAPDTPDESEKETS